MHPHVKTLPMNLAGNDYVVGDIHGAYDLLFSAVNASGLDPARDRLILVGDLGDRGKYSKLARSLLLEPWVHAVRGNHEEIFLDLYAAGEPDPKLLEFHVEKNGLGWTLELTAQERAQFCAAYAALPYAIEVPTKRGDVGIVHAEVPPGMTWPYFVKKLKAGDRLTMKSALWGRERVKQRIHAGVPGIGRVFCGHTVQDNVRRLGNVYLIDTAAVYRNLGYDEGCLTMADVMTKTAIIQAPRKKDAQVHLLTGIGTGLFGNYATSN